MNRTLMLLSLTAVAVACTSGPSDSYPDEGCAGGCQTGSQCVDGRCQIDATCSDRDGDLFGDGCDFGPDCDDDNRDVNRLAIEACNGIDDDCDGEVDEDGVCPDCDGCTPGTVECVSDVAYRECRAFGECARWLPLGYCDFTCQQGACLAQCDDRDGDGYGEGCELGPDCDERNPYAWPGRAESCDGYDNDCDGSVDEDDVCDVPCQEDCVEGARGCDGAGFRVCVLDLRDCPIWSATIRCPGVETCVEGFCEAPVECRDLDGDGYGHGCELGPDCDDFASGINGGVTESCDGADDQCDGRVDEGIAGCPAQWCQDNLHSSVATSRPLAADQVGAGYLCAGESELWRLGPLEANAQLLVASSAPREAAASLELMRVVDGSPETVDQSAGGGAVEAGPENGEFLLGVHGSGASNQPYQVRWAPWQAVCHDDPREPNGSPGSASDLWPSSVVTGTICTGDLDFYRIRTLEAGQIISVDLWTFPDQELLLEVWYDGVSIVPDQRPEPGSRHAHFRADLPGDYLVSVRALQTAATGAYLLSVAPARDGPCLDDNLERSSGADNDTLATATVLAHGSATATLCPGDLDVYYVGEYDVGGAISVTVSFDAAAMNLDAFLFRDSMAGFAQLAKTDSSPEVLPTGISRAGAYYVVVLGRSPVDTGSYTIAF